MNVAAVWPFLFFFYFFSIFQLVFFFLFLQIESAGPFSSQRSYTASKLLSIYVKKKRATGENTKWARRLYAERWGVNQSYKSPNALHKFPAETSLLFPSFLFLVFLVFFFLLLWTFYCISFLMPMSLFFFPPPKKKKKQMKENKRKKEHF